MPEYGHIRTTGRWHRRGKASLLLLALGYIGVCFGIGATTVCDAMRERDVKCDALSALRLNKYYRVGQVIQYEPVLHKQHIVLTIL